MTYTYTLTVAGTTYTATSTGYPACRECMGRIYAHSRTDEPDERTEADYDAWRYACMLRNQAADDAALYNTQDRPDAWGVGY